MLVYTPATFTCEWCFNKYSCEDLEPLSTIDRKYYHLPQGTMQDFETHTLVEGPYAKVRRVDLRVIEICGRCYDKIEAADTYEAYQTHFLNEQEEFQQEEQITEANKGLDLL